MKNNAELVESIFSKYEDYKEKSRKKRVKLLAVTSVCSTTAIALVVFSISAFVLPNKSPNKRPTDYNNTALTDISEPPAQSQINPNQTTPEINSPSTSKPNNNTPGVTEYSPSNTPPDNSNDNPSDNPAVTQNPPAVTVPTQVVTQKPSVTGVTSPNNSGNNTSPAETAPPQGGQDTPDTTYTRRTSGARVTTRSQPEYTEPNNEPTDPPSDAPNDTTDTPGGIMPPIGQTTAPPPFAPPPFEPTPDDVPSTPAQTDTTQPEPPSVDPPTADTPSIYDYTYYFNSVAELSEAIKNGFGEDLLYEIRNAEDWGKKGQFEDFINYSRQNSFLVPMYSGRMMLLADSREVTLTASDEFLEMPCILYRPSDRITDGSILSMSVISFPGRDFGSANISEVISEINPPSPNVNNQGDYSGVYNTYETTISLKDRDVKAICYELNSGRTYIRFLYEGCLVSVFVDSSDVPVSWLSNVSFNVY
jgi:hypothetical protein